MGTSERSDGDGGIDNPDIQPAESGIDQADLLPGGEVALHEVDDRRAEGGIGDPDQVPTESGIGNPDLVPADEVALHEVDDRPSDRGIQDPNTRDAYGGPDTQPSSGLSLTFPKLLGLGAAAAVVFVAAIMVLNSGGGGAGPAAPGTANLVVTGAEISGPWTLDVQSGDVKPTATLITAVWTKSDDNVAAGFGDFITLTISGTIVEGTQVTSLEGVGVGFSINRVNTAGADVVDHVFSSTSGECEVTMQRSSSGVSGRFTCAGIKDEQGHAVTASGAFAT